MKLVSNVKVGDRLLSVSGAPMVREILPAKVETHIGFRVTGGLVVWRAKSDRINAKKATPAEIHFESL